MTIMRPLRPLAVALVVAGLALGGDAAPAASQLVYGFVVDATTGERLAASYVALLDTSGTVVATGYAGATGDFALRAPGKRLYRLRASRLGYEGLATETIDLRSEPSVSLLVRLHPVPIPLPSLTVQAERRVARLREEGFYDRKKIGFGHFVTPEMLERHHLRSVADIARFFPGADGVYAPGGRPVDLILRGGRGLRKGRTCLPSILVDGVLRRDASTNAAPSLDDVVDIADVLAVEVYPDAAGMPVQAAGLGGFCGAILLWTKR